MSRESLLAEIEAFLSRSDVEMTETAFGLSAVRDGKFVGDLRRGRRVWPETAEKVRKFIAEFRKPPRGAKKQSSNAIPSHGSRA